MNDEIRNLGREVADDFNELDAQLKGHRDKMNQLKDKIALAENSAKAARAEYNRLMEAGERIAAEKAIDEIKPLRERAAGLYRELKELESFLPKLRVEWIRLLTKAGQLRTLAREEAKKVEKEHIDLSVSIARFFVGASPVDSFDKSLQNCIGSLKQDYYK